MGLFSNQIARHQSTQQLGASSTPRKPKASVPPRQIGAQAPSGQNGAQPPSRTNGAQPNSWMFGPRMCTISLVVFNNPISLAHWSIYLLPQGSTTGTKIHIRGLPLGGFELEITACNESDSRSRREKFHLGNLDMRALPRVKSIAQGIDANGAGHDLTSDQVSRTFLSVFRLCCF